MRAALAQAWPPFVLVAGLILVGLCAARDGLFTYLGRVLARAPGGGAALLAAALAGAAVVTAVLNLDTAAVFATPVLVLAARERGVDERPFLYGALFMANASSLFLPGSNLTNLLVLGHGHLGGLAFARRLAPEAVAATLATLAGVMLYARRSRPSVPGAPAPKAEGAVPLRPAGVVATAVAAILVLALARPAVPVLVLGVLGVASLVAQRRLTLGEAVRALGPAVLLGLFAVAVALGTLARHWDAPAHLVRDAAAAPTAVLAAVASVLVNNLPAAALLSAGPVRHPSALLLGLNVGPNLAVTGSLSAVLWWRSARSVGARPSALTVTRVGVVLAPVGIGAGLVARLLFG